MKNNKRQERYDRNYIRIINKTMTELRQERKRIDGLDEILNNLEDVFVHRNLPSTKPIIGTFCYMVPDEIIIAAGGFPIKLCGGNYIAQIAGDEITPRDACPVVKSILGSFEMNLNPIYQQCDLAVVPMSCDGKKRMVNKLSEYVNVLPLHIPSIKNDETINIVKPQYYALIHEVEKITNCKITESTLRKALKLTQNINYEINKFMSFKKKRQNIFTGTQAMCIVSSYQFIERDKYLNYIRRINIDIEKKWKSNHKRTNSKPRILLTGSPFIFPNFKVPSIIESIGGNVCADETCAGDRMLYDPVLPTEMTYEGIIHALIVKAIMPCTCPTFSLNIQRRVKIKQLVKQHNIEGIVYNILRGCTPYDYELRDIEILSKEIDTPIIAIETDYNNEDKEQLKIRLEAFVEMLKMKG